MKPRQFSDYFAMLAHVAKWCALALLVAVLAGSASALFLWLLDVATARRLQDPWLIALLPLAGFAVGWLYLRYGRNVEAGNNLLLAELHAPSAVVPLRMAPLVLFGTVVSHLFGASVGREGTALQMGGALADQLSLPFRLPPPQRRLLIMAGMSAGFASVFGTPLAGAIFGLEVLAIGTLRYDAILPCFVAAVAADRIGLLWGAHHTQYSVPLVPPMTLWTLLATLVAGVLFGLVAWLFAGTTRALSGLMKRHISYAPLRPLIGGALVALAVWGLGSTRYIGLGIPVIVDAFHQQLAWHDAAGKFLFTVASLGSGFKGGEVTPLFFIGATLGNALAPLLQMPFPVLAAIGFVAVFAGAANTPIASAVMAMELFGPAIGPYAALACVVSYMLSGHAGIYSAQRIGLAKGGGELL